MSSIRKRSRSRQRAKPASLDSIAHVVSRMREGVSLTQASAEYGISPRTVVRYGGSALRQGASGRYLPKTNDNLPRTLVVPVHGGYEEFAVRGSRAASEIAKRSNAQKHFLQTGDTSEMRSLRGTKVYDTSGREVPFLTDLDELERLGSAGVLSFESIYARGA